MQKRCSVKANYKIMKYLIISAYILFSTVLFSCQSNLLTVYKIDVQQGNALDVEAVNKIAIGMNREQVQYVLGAPIITDSFHPDRWGYIYLFTPGYGEQVRKQLILTFDRDEIIDITKRNIVEDNIASNIPDDVQEANEDDREELSEKDQEELEELEEQADALNEVLEENNNLEN